ncbi:MAG: class I SAM-dependent methyltransferase [Vicinamibacterales bacterium]
MPQPTVNLWRDQQHATQYLVRADSVPHRAEGEAALLEWMPRPLRRVLDLGSGDGRLLRLIIRGCAPAESVALDFSVAMLERLRARFDAQPSVRIVSHDLDHPLPVELGEFDAIVSSFAIHHLVHARKRALYAEIHERLRPGGVFCNLEHVSSPTAALHQQFLGLLDVAPGDEDPSNKLLDMQTQLDWLREIGFGDVDCHWKWRELALLAGRRA